MPKNIQGNVNNRYIEEIMHNRQYFDSKIFLNDTGAVINLSQNKPFIPNAKTAKMYP
jgi:hypothetical protein